MTLFAFAQKAAQDVAVRGRLALGGFLASVGSLQARGGFVQGGASVSVVPGTMQVQVSAFQAFVQGSAGGQGVYPVVNDSPSVVTLPNGGATDTVYTLALVVQDNAFDASGFTDPVLVAYAAGGAPAGSILPIREITVPAGKTSGNGGLVSGNIGTDLRQYSAGLGGTIPVANSAQETSLLAIAKDGQQIVRLDTGDQKIKWNGSFQRLWTPNNVAAPKVAFTPTLESVWDTPANCFYQVLGQGLIFMQITVLRNGSTLSMSSNGNAKNTGIVQVGGVPSPARPGSIHYWNGFVGDGDGRIGGRFHPDGSLKLDDGNSNLSIVNNKLITIQSLHVGV